MNQILATEPVNHKKKKGSHQPAEIHQIIKVFSIVLILFGVFMVGTGSYALYKGGEETEGTPTIPLISIETQEDDTILLKIIHDKQIESVSYHWDQEPETVIKGNQRNSIEQQITVPEGNHTLYVTAKDKKGQANYYQNSYGNKITLASKENGNISVTYTGDTEISYMTYRWDEEEEKRIDINDTEVDEEIEAIKGEHTLTVILVDINQKTQKKEQVIQGIAKPTLVVTIDDDKQNFLIKASDESGLEKIEITIDEGETKTLEITQNEFKGRIPIKAGENKLKVTVYNKEGMSDTARVKATKQ